MYNIYYDDESNSLYKILEKTFFIYVFIIFALTCTIICAASIGLNLYLFFQDSNEVNLYLYNE